MGGCKPFGFAELMILVLGIHNLHSKELMGTASVEGPGRVLRLGKKRDFELFHQWVYPFRINYRHRRERPCEPISQRNQMSPKSPLKSPKSVR